MGSFTNGVLVGLGVSLLFAPMKGEDMRRLLSERVKEMRENSSNNLGQQRLTSRVEEVRQQASHTSPTGTTPQTTAGGAYSTPATSSSATQSTGTARPASPAGPAEKSQTTGTTRPQSGSNAPGSRSNRPTS